MARIFAITTTTDTIQLDASGQGEAAFTITNNSDRLLEGQVKLKPQPPTDLSWLSLAQDIYLEFPKNATHNATVQIKVPPGTAPGKYPFRIDVVSTARPDEDFTEGPSVIFTVQPSKAPAKKPFPWWILAVAAVVLAVGGVFAWLLFFRSVAVPDVTGKRLELAIEELENEGLRSTEVETESNNPAEAGVVLSQDPQPETEVKRGSNINLTVGVAPAEAPGDRFVGSWVNVDSSTRSNTRIEITRQGEKLTIHTWGSCSPTDCDWGEESLLLTDENMAQVSWDQGFVLRQMVLTLEGSELKVVTDSVYDDDRPRRQTIEMFVRN